MLRLDRRALIASVFFSLVSACSRPAKANRRTFSNVAELRDFIVAELRRRPGVDSVVADPADQAKFEVTMGEWSSTGTVANAFAYLKAYPDEDADKVLGRFMNSIFEGRSMRVEERNILPVIRVRNYLEQMDPKPIYEPFGADLIVVYMVDRPDSMSPITAKDVPGKNLASIRALALGNLEKWLPKVVSDDSIGDGTMFYVEANPMLSPSLMLLDSFWKSIAARFAGDVLIALPRKDQLFLFDDGDPAVQSGVRRLIDVTIEEGANLLSATLYARRGGKIVMVKER